MSPWCSSVPIIVWVFPLPNRQEDEDKHIRCECLRSHLVLNPIHFLTSLTVCEHADVVPIQTTLHQGLCTLPNVILHVTGLENSIKAIFPRLLSLRQASAVLVWLLDYDCLLGEIRVGGGPIFVGVCGSISRDCREVKG